MTLKQIFCYHKYKIDSMNQINRIGIIPPDYLFEEIYTCSKCKKQKIKLMVHSYNNYIQ